MILARSDNTKKPRSDILIELYFKFHIKDRRIFNSSLSIAKTDNLDQVSLAWHWDMENLPLYQTEKNLRLIKWKSSSRLFVNEKNQASSQMKQGTMKLFNYLIIIDY
ncbi:6110_t:CDS:2 [Ambispora gerdemannii]|uniref:6110_t:CDS:1 n=1 Tax=Ambispora gerdemannii TaxID=144530 RepID=A0A9N9CYZ5_9GLOM|nr:6110_t:CDS:2 [Ambispora gerdemannii]